jgi:hypothetical protein
VPYGRAFVRGALGAWQLPDLGPDVELCVSELITNAVRYGTGPVIGLALSLTASCSLQVEVFNRDGGAPLVGVPDQTGEYGRGLLLVSELSSCWGHGLVFGHWRRVWCRFALPAEPPPAP